MTRKQIKEQQLAIKRVITAALEAAYPQVEVINTGYNDRVRMVLNSANAFRITVRWERSWADSSFNPANSDPVQIEHD